MKQIYHILFTILLVFATVQIGFSANKYAVASGNWGVTSTWSLTRGGASGAAVPTSVDSVFIPGTYTVTVEASSKTVKDLIVESGATLKSNSTTLGTPVYIRVYNSITNNGTIGASNDALGCQAYSSALTINGSGTTNFNRMAPSVASTITFNTNVTLYYPGSALYCNGNAATFTINAGKTLTLAGTGSYFSIGTSGSNVPGTGAVWTCNVYGTVSVTGGATQINMQNTGTNLSTLHVYNGGTINTVHDLLGNTSGTGAVVIVDQGGAINFTGVSRNCNLGIATTTVNGTIDFGTSATGSRTLGTATVGNTGKLRLQDATLPSGITLNTGSTVEYYSASTPVSITLPAGYTTYSNLIITNSAGCTLGASTTVNGTLTLQGGKFTTGASNTLTIGSSGSVTKTSGWIVGNLAKAISGSSSSATFEIGDATYYAPVSLTFNGVSTAGTVTATTTSGDHPQILNSSGINSASSVNRYWTLTNGGVAFTTYAATFNFNSSDLDAGADYSTFVGSNYASSVWTPITVGTKASTSTQLTGNTLFGDFAIGNAATSDPTISIGGSLSSFGPVVINTVSAAEKSYTVAAVNLTDTLTITPPAGVMISTTSGAEASTPITLTPSGGTINPAVTIYVKFAPTVVGSFSANIAHTSPGATYQYVAVTGLGEAAEPTTASTALEFSNIAPTSMTVSWTPGDGENHLVIARAGNSVSANPTDANSYTANAAYGSGALITSGYVVYSGSGSTFTLTGLTEGTLYYFAVYEYNGTPGSGTENYLTSSTLTGVRGANIIQSYSTSFTGNWSSPSSWIGGVVPTSSDNVKIGSTAIITVDSANAVCHNLSFGSSTGSKLSFASNSVLSIYGDLTFYSSTSNHINSWTAGGKLKFTGADTLQTIRGLATSATANTSTPIYELIIDKSAGRVTTEGTDVKMMLVTSMEIVNGTFRLNTADDIQGYDNVAATTPTITVDAGGKLEFYGSGANSLRSGTSGSAPIGKLTIAGTVSSFVTTSTLGLSPGGIDILNGGILYIPSGWSGGSQGLHGGAITIYSGGILSLSTTSNVWDATCSVDLQDGGIFRASATTTVFPTTFTNNGTVQYARSTAGADEVITDMNYKNLWISDSGCPKSWTMGADRNISGNLIVDAGTTLNLSGSSLTVNGTITENGIVNAASTLKLGSSASVTGETSGSYIKGTVQAVRSVSGSSPVEIAGLGITLNPNSNDLGSTTITRVSGTSATVTVNGNSGINRKWTITPTTQPSSGVSVSLSWLSDDNNGKDLTKLHVWKSDDAGATWSDIAGPIDGSSQSVMFTTSSFSDFTITDEGTPLPVELTSFTAETSSNAVVLKWNTATERNNSGFQVERKINGSFQKIAFVQGNGTSNSPKNYSFTDSKLKDNGTYTYRLKQIDNDGTFSYSKEVEVSVKIIPAEYALHQNYPNPFNPSTSIQVALPSNSKVRLSIYNAIGQEVVVLSNNVLEAGTHTFTWNAANMPSGLYYYTIDASSIGSKQSFKETKKMLLIK